MYILVRSLVVPKHKEFNFKKAQTIHFLAISEFQNFLLTRKKITILFKLRSLTLLISCYEGDGLVGVTKGRHFRTKIAAGYYCMHAQEYIYFLELKDISNHNILTRLLFEKLLLVHS